MPRVLRRVVLGLVFMSMGTGCGSTAISPSDPPDDAASAAGSISPRPSAGATGTGELCAVGHEPCPLEPGDYTAAPFEPNFSFTIDEGWTNDRAFADGGGISRQSGGIYWASGVSEGRIGDEEIEIGASVDDFVTYLGGLEAIGMAVSEPEPVTIDGVSGQQVDVASNEAEAPGLYQIAEDVFHLVPDETARFLVLDKDGETVLLVVDSFASDGFDAWLATAQPVLDSIRWE